MKCSSFFFSKTSKTKKSRGQAFCCCLFFLFFVMPLFFARFFRIQKWSKMDPLFFFSKEKKSHFLFFSFSFYFARKGLASPSARENETLVLPGFNKIMFLFFLRRGGRQRHAVAVGALRNASVDAVEAELDRGLGLGRERLGEEGGEEELGRLAGKDLFFDFF